VTAPELLMVASPERSRRPGRREVPSRSWPAVPVIEPGSWTRSGDQREAVRERQYGAGDGERPADLGGVEETVRYRAESLAWRPGRCAGRAGEARPGRSGGRCVGWRQSRRCPSGHAGAAGVVAAVAVSPMGVDDLPPPLVDGGPGVVAAKEVVELAVRSPAATWRRAGGDLRGVVAMEVVGRK